VLDENLALESDEVTQVEGVTEREAQLGEQFSEIALWVKALSADVQTDLGVSEAIVVSREVNRPHVLRPGLQFLQPEVCNSRDGHVVQTFRHVSKHAFDLR
jgi:hypothetical protein